MSIKVLMNTLLPLLQRDLKKSVSLFVKLFTLESVYSMVDCIEPHYLVVIKVIEKVFKNSNYTNTVQIPSTYSHHEVLRKYYCK